MLRRSMRNFSSESQGRSCCHWKLRTKMPCQWQLSVLLKLILLWEEWHVRALLQIILHQKWRLYWSYFKEVFPFWWDISCELPSANSKFLPVGARLPILLCAVEWCGDSLAIYIYLKILKGTQEVWETFCFIKHLLIFMEPQMYGWRRHVTWPAELLEKPGIWGTHFVGDGTTIDISGTWFDSSGWQLH